MTWVNLGNPVPKQKVDKYIPYKWDLSNKSIRLDEPEIFTPIPFTQVMFERKSQRSFKLVSIDHLSHLLWLTNRVKDCIDSTMGFPITLRPVPSAGAIHPIHILRAGILGGFLSKNLSVERNYLELEEEFLSFSRGLGIKASELDAVIWLEMMSSSSIVHELMNSSSIDTDLKFKKRKEPITQLEMRI